MLPIRACTSLGSKNRYDVLTLYMSLYEFRGENYTGMLALRFV